VTSAPEPEYASGEIRQAAELARAAHAGQVDQQQRDYFDAHLAPIARGARALAHALLGGERGCGERIRMDDGRDPVAGPGTSSNGGRIVVAAWLHDVIEDTDTTLADLAAHGVDPEAIAAVDSVTRRADESYEELISRSCAHPVGRLVKLVDNAWNLTSNAGLARTDPERARELREERYLPARTRLLGAAELTEDSPAVLRMQRTLDGERERLR